MGKYDLDQFHTQPDPNLICPICQCILEDAVESPCRHVFCRECIEKWLENRSTCPSCRARLTSADLHQVHPIIQNMISGLPMKCANLSNGCKQKIQLEHFETHTKDCGYEKVKCCHPRCVKQVLKKDAAGHQNRCGMREVLCKLDCQLMIPVKEQRRHHCLSALKDRVQELRKKLADSEEAKQKLEDRNLALETQIKENEAALVEARNQNNNNSDALSFSDLNWADDFDDHSSDGDDDWDDDDGSSYFFDGFDDFEEEFPEELTPATSDAEDEAEREEGGDRGDHDGARNNNNSDAENNSEGNSESVRYSVDGQVDSRMAPRIHSQTRTVGESTISPSGSSGYDGSSSMSFPDNTPEGVRDIGAETEVQNDSSDRTHQSFSERSSDSEGQDSTHSEHDYHSDSRSYSSHHSDNRSYSSHASSGASNVEHSPTFSYRCEQERSDGDSPVYSSHSNFFSDRSERLDSPDSTCSYGQQQTPDSHRSSGWHTDSLAWSDKEDHHNLYGSPISNKCSRSTSFAHSDSEEDARWSTYGSSPGSYRSFISGSSERRSSSRERISPSPDRRSSSHDRSRSCDRRSRSHDRRSASPNRRSSPSSDRSASTNRTTSPYRRSPSGRRRASSSRSTSPRSRASPNRRTASPARRVTSDRRIASSSRSSLSVRRRRGTRRRRRASRNRRRASLGRRRSSPDRRSSSPDRRTVSPDSPDYDSDESSRKSDHRDSERDSDTRNNGGSHGDSSDDQSWRSASHCGTDQQSDSLDCGTSHSHYSDHDASDTHGDSYEGQSPHSPRFSERSSRSGNSCSSFRQTDSDPNSSFEASASGHDGVSTSGRVLSEGENSTDHESSTTRSRHLRHKSRKRTRSSDEEFEGSPRKRHHRSGTRSPSPTSSHTSTPSSLRSHRTTKASNRIRLSSYHMSGQSTSHVQLSVEVVSHRNSHHADPEPELAYEHRSLPVSANNSSSNAARSRGERRQASTSQEQVSRAASSSNSARSGRRRRRAQRETSGEAASQTDNSEQNRDRTSQRQPIDHQSVRTYAQLLEQYAQESPNDNSDDTYEPPSAEPPDVSVSDVSEDDATYLVHVPKTAAQLLEEYQSGDSDDSWTPT